MSELLDIENYIENLQKLKVTMTTVNLILTSLLNICGELSLMVIRTIGCMVTMGNGWPHDV